MVDTFTTRVIEVIRQIPSGRVATYGMIAFAAGNPRGARQVVRILHTSSGKHDLPWYRVVNRYGEIPYRPSLDHVLQRDLLCREGVKMSESGLIDLGEYLWQP